MVEVVVPSPGESITEVTLGTWRKSDGDWVEKDELLNEIDSDKATLELLSPASGAIRLVAKSGTEQKVGTLVAKIDETASRPAGSVAAKNTKATAVATVTPTAKEPSKTVPKVSIDSPTRISGVAKKMAADRGIDAGALEGSGPSGRVMKIDIEGAAKSGGATAVTIAHASKALPGTRTIRREKMTRLRQRIAERLVSAQHTAAMLTTFNEVDMTEVIRLRKEHKADFEKTHGVSLGFMGFFLRSCVSALQHFPRANAYLAGDEMEFHEYVDVGVAVGTERGLVVPVIRNAEAMALPEIEKTLKSFALRARDGKLTVDEMTGGTFTISNGGVYGSLMSTPILNPPQSAILGMHTIKKRAVEDPHNPGQIALRPMMYLALSYDHRIIDGSEAVGFLVHVKDCIENPERLLLDV
ncbi:MAG: 2-oxoglutarate dehydrogenase complex dihydrolipoyllysine-residue succinyltransferase [Planctomycetota bacterium]|nr:2-oxoglutarate dehydrogenase complex dihydrolipoyllysine-residue succinyltransferase [Planctomycetota bacterium]MDA1261340.1 2-oxoglutarate dehydrogenase complex dihydrolipoyllysine-residue succinyltransferase [Planctomycetota bacterium]